MIAVLLFVLVTVVTSEIVYETNLSDNPRLHKILSSIDIPDEKLIDKEELKRGQYIHEDYYDENEINVIQGVAGIDYPTYGIIPQTMFSCFGRIQPGYYADIEARCQVFHICLPGGQKSSFLCPNGSLFNQIYSVCDWWYEVNCDSTLKIIESARDVPKLNQAGFRDYDYNLVNDNHFFVPASDVNDLYQQSSSANKNTESNKLETVGKADNYKTNNDTILNYVNLFKNAEIVPKRRNHNEKQRINNTIQLISKFEDVDETKVNTDFISHRSDVSDLRNSQNEAYYGGLVQNTFNKKFQATIVNSNTQKFKPL